LILLGDAEGALESGTKDKTKRFHSFGTFWSNNNHLGGGRGVLTSQIERRNDLSNM
jgi:hypothetical protein